MTYTNWCALITANIGLLYSETCCYDITIDLTPNYVCGNNGVSYYD